MNDTCARTYPRTAMRTCFGDFILDTDQRQLSRGDELVHLTPKALALLQYLVERQPDAVAKGDLLQRVWPSTFVSEGSLTSVVKELRKALGDSARAPRFVRSVRSFGYAFRGQAHVGTDATTATRGRGASPAQEFRVTWQQREVALAEGDNLLGRTRQAALWVEHVSVSRRHACIRIAGANATIEDCGSKNGTFVRGERITGPRELHSGDEIVLGRACVVVHAYPAEGSTGSVDSRER